MPPISFEGFRVACLTGSNGHGKSALLDAITWALWGRARAADDDLIHQGQSEMEVVYDFALDEGRYRVVRRRARGRLNRPGQTVLELLVWPSLDSGLGSGLRTQDSGPLLISGNSVHDTQRKITHLLRMDYETFVNSAFLLQGRADEFTRRRPGERKEILARVLGLDYYDRLEELARQEVRLREGQMAALEGEVAVLERDLSGQPDWEAELAANRQARASVEEELQTLAGRLEGLRERLRRAEALAQEMAEGEAAQRRAQEERDRAGQQAAAARQRQVALDAVAARRTEIEAGRAALGAARLRNEELTGLMDRVAELESRRVGVERELAHRRGVLESELEGGRREARRLAGLVAGLPAQRVARQEAESALARWAAEATAAHQRRGGLEVRQQELAEARAATEQVKREGLLLADKLKLMGEPGARCPICGSALGADGLERLRGQMGAEIDALRLAYRLQEAGVRQRQTELEAEQRRLQQEEEEVEQARRGAADRLSRLQLEIDRAEGEAADLPRLAAREAELQEALEVGATGRSPLRDLLAELERLEAEIAAAGYTRAEHQRADAELRELEPWAEAHRRLQEAAVALPAAVLAVAELVEAGARWAAEAAQIEARLAGLRSQVLEPAARAELRQGLADHEAALALRAARAGELEREAGALEERLARAAERRGQLEAARRRRQQISAERDQHAELVVAFGKRGIQALLIEEALPEIAADATALLGRMTDNRMHLALESQRATQRGGVVETLEIRIGDELGTRPYELFSGGEAFRVNFALRVALSRLLARRAGARLLTLVVDEGFGTQDGAGREKLVEAIHAVESDFEKVLVITHMEEMKEAFPVHLEVTKGDQGSMVTLRTAALWP